MINFITKEQKKVTIKKKRENSEIQKSFVKTFWY